MKPSISCVKPRRVISIMLERSPLSDLKHPTRRNVKRRVKHALKQRPRWLAIDAESRSTSNLSDDGPDVYSLCPDTEVRKLGMFAHDGTLAVWHWGEPPHPLFIKAAKEGWKFIIHNAPFDHTLLMRNLCVRHGFPAIPYDRCIDTMTRALAMGLPAGLGDLADALGTTHRKDRILERQNRRAYRPRRARKDENPDGGPYYHDEPSDDYAIQDVGVAAELHLHPHVPELIPIERELELHTHVVNERGFPADIELAEDIVKLTQQALAEINAKLAKLTNGKITSINQVGKILEFAKTLGYRGHSLDREAVDRQLARNDLDPLLRKVLSLRRQVGNAVKKFPALLACVSPDGRVRFTLQYHGAGPGRWSGRRFQPQNLRRLSLKPEEVETAITAIKTGDLKHLKKLYANPLELMGEMGRPAVISGHKRQINGRRPQQHRIARFGVAASRR